MPLLPDVPRICILMLFNLSRLQALFARLCSLPCAHIPRSSLSSIAACNLETDVPAVARDCLDFRRLLSLPTAVIHLLSGMHCYQMLDALLHPSQPHTVTELPPVVCFYTLVHCLVPVTLDGCPAAAAEAILPAPFPA